MIEIYIYGQPYQVPEGLTILKAFEWAGFQLKRGVGCRAGFCGACGTVYRFADDYRLNYALACQTVAQRGMVLGTIPFFPAQRSAYNLAALQPTVEVLLDIYPEIITCFGCNTCTKSCPQELDVLSYMAAALRGDVEDLADASFDCIMCGLCVARCPAELVPPNVALLGRRLYGKFLAPRAEHLHRRIQEIKTGNFQAEIQELMSLPLAELKTRYEARQIEA
ncbi:MAG TPA: 4Fe-4S dicluster domain-containing protein [Anaerolineales bacterium]|nr:4Fe-4S dicluster domain-containing protein [Anaerolineales bacterium]